MLLSVYRNYNDFYIFTDKIFLLSAKRRLFPPRHYLSLNAGAALKISNRFRCCTVFINYKLDAEVALPPVTFNLIKQKKPLVATIFHRVTSADLL